MSSAYSMELRVKRYRKDRVQDIQSAAEKEWSGFSCSSEEDGAIYVNGIGQLFGGDLEQDFVARITRVVWKANGTFCTVEVFCACLSEVPFNVYELDEGDHGEWLDELADEEETKG